VGKLYEGNSSHITILYKINGSLAFARSHLFTTVNYETRVIFLNPYVSRSSGYTKVHHSGSLHSFMSRLLLFTDMNTGLYVVINGPRTTKTKMAVMVMKVNFFCMTVTINRTFGFQNACFWDY